MHIFVGFSTWGCWIFEKMPIFVTAEMLIRI